MATFAWPPGGHWKYFCMLGAHSNLCLAIRWSLKIFLYIGCPWHPSDLGLAFQGSLCLRPRLVWWYTRTLYKDRVQLRRPCMPSLYTVLVQSLGWRQREPGKWQLQCDWLKKVCNKIEPSVTNEQASNSRRFDDWHGWIQGCGFSDSELFPEFRFAKLELRALLQTTYYCHNELRARSNKLLYKLSKADFAQFDQNYWMF